MSRIQSISTEDAQGEVKTIYQDLEKKMGKVINIFSHMGNSPVTLKAFLNLSEAANHTTLAPKIREEIALIVGQSNHCNYCLSAHTALAKNLGLNEQDIIKARHAESTDPKTQAILKFTKAVIESRGNVSNQDVASLKASGVNDQELVDLVLVIMVNMFTNYFNLITDPKIDFPLAQDIH